MAGLDGMTFLRSTDPIEVMAMQALSRRVEKLTRDYDRSRANMIANAVWEGIKL